MEQDLMNFEIRNGFEIFEVGILPGGTKGIMFLLGDE